VSFDELPQDGIGGRLGHCETTANDDAQEFGLHIQIDRLRHSAPATFEEKLCRGGLAQGSIGVQAADNQDQPGPTLHRLHDLVADLLNDILKLAVETSRIAVALAPLGDRRASLDQRRRVARIGLAPGRNDLGNDDLTQRR